jgi:hypothetical protein
LTRLLIAAVMCFLGGVVVLVGGLLLEFRGNFESDPATHGLSRIPVLIGVFGIVLSVVLGAAILWRRR